MTEPRKVTIQCSDCEARIRITVKREHEGKRTQVRCKCGLTLRVRLPEQPRNREVERMTDEWLRDFLHRPSPFGY